MSIPRSDRRDINESEIVEYFRKHGASVKHRSGVGSPDLDVGYEDVNVLIEIKSKDGKLNDAQKKWHREWNGTVFVVRNVQDAQRVLRYCENLSSIGRGVYESAKKHLSSG